MLILVLSILIVSLFAENQSLILANRVVELLMRIVRPLFITNA